MTEKKLTFYLNKNTINKLTIILFRVPIKGFMLAVIKSKRGAVSSFPLRTNGTPFLRPACNVYFQILYKSYLFISIS